MKKIYIFTAVVSLVSAVVLAGPSAVFAQYSYAPSYVYVAPSTTSYAPIATYVPPTYGNVGQCTSLTYGLYKGLSDANTGGQVSLLQSFLISQGDLTPNAIKGYFGSLTYQALVQYQLAHGLPVSGTVDTATLSSIQTVSCGNYYGGYNYGDYYNRYNNNYVTPTINSLSQTSGPVGASVTIYGSGFDSINNRVNFNGVSLSGIPSYNGTALAFTIPQVYAQTYSAYSNYGCNYSYSNCNNNINGGAYNVSVTTSHGTSNSMVFTVTFGSNCFGNSYSYNNCYGSPVSVSNITGPTSITTGVQGSWSLTLYNPNNNYVSVGVKWGDENTYANYNYVSSQSSQSLNVQGQQNVTFTHTYQTSGYYTVVFTATDSRGVQSTVSTTVNVSGSSYQSKPYISTISPTSGRVGSSVTIYGSGFSGYGNTVHFGNGGKANLSSVNNGTAIYFTIPYSVSGCDLTTGGAFCPMFAQQVTPGSYPVYVSNTFGQSSILYFTVTY